MNWTTARVAAGLLLGGALLVAFVAIDAREAEPLLPLSLLGLIFVFSIFFQSARHLSPLATGVAFLPMTALVSVANIASGRLTARLGARTVMLAGLALATVGALSLLMISSGSAPVLTAPLFAMTGCGVAFAVPAMMTTAFSGRIAAREGTAAGVLNAVRQTGAAFGVALMGSVLGSDAGANLVHGLHVAIVLAVLAFLGGIVAAAMARPDAAVAGMAPMTRPAE